MIVCEMCKGKSTVCETRETPIKSDGAVRKQMETVTQVRTRRCLECDYRWRTIELAIRVGIRVKNKSFSFESGNKR